MWIMFFACLGGFLASYILVKMLIPLLRKLKIGQVERASNSAEHLAKAGTPNMGGVALMGAMVLVLAILLIFFPEDVPFAKIWPVMALTVTFTVVGAIDDYLKVKKHSADGLTAWQKLLAQIVLGTGFVLYCYFSPGIGSKIVLPFSGGREWDLGIFYIPFGLLVILGTDNGVNLTDGVDGLVSSVTLPVCAFFMLTSSLFASRIYASLIAGILMGFLIHNAHPAKIFMGDSGALGLGGFIASMALINRTGLFALLFGLIYLIESLSVIIQVISYQTTGKRVFLRTPIHHHFEKLHYSETQIVTGFTIFALFSTALAFLAFG